MDKLNQDSRIDRIHADNFLESVITGANDATEQWERRLKARDAESERRRQTNMEPATFNYMEDVPKWMQYDPMFNAIWDEIKTWDINVPTEYGGYDCTGSNVAAILAAIIDKGLYIPAKVGDLGNALPEVRV